MMSYEFGFKKVSVKHSYKAITKKCDKLVKIISDDSEGLEDEIHFLINGYEIFKNQEEIQKLFNCRNWQGEETRKQWEDICEKHELDPDYHNVALLFVNKKGYLSWGISFQYHC